MKAPFFYAVLCAAALVVGGFPNRLGAGEPGSQTDSAARPAHGSGQTARIAQAAQALLDTLDEAQRSKVIFKFGDKEQRARWSNLPTGMVKRKGLRMGDLTPDQRKAVMTLLSVTLSKMGYEKILGIMDGDEVLKNAGGGGGPAFGRDEFYVSFLGTPSATTPWMLQFGGHHLALNVTFVGEQGVMTPSLIAVQPARYSLNGRTVRPLGRETDKAFELVGSLNANQRKEAVLGFQMHDLVLGPGHDGETIQPEGIKASALTDRQQQMLLELVAEWSGIIHDTAAAEKMIEIKANLADTWFAWSGPTEPGSAAYFRVQGPTVVIEYAPQRLGGDPTQHIHTMYRDFTNDYGKKLLGQ
ncbi:MAG TPA: DUF3500 domain-containing protein [Gemmataceae bacterium]|nr:DUF3500 domain-containing protein [Gemmataceae bacterium]